MPLYYPQMLVDEINSLILVSKDDTAIIENHKKVMVLLRQAGAVTKQVLHTSQVLCHPKNRAGLMLNGFNAHRNAANVMHIGADRDQLKGAIAFETSPFPIERQHQLEANIKIAKNSKGLIAMPGGDERFMSVGTGHMVCFCRAANGGCITQIVKLQDPQTKTISSERLKRNPEMKAMLEIGWEFETVAHSVEATWPSIPEFMQRALNAVNGIAAEATEMETAITIAENVAAMEPKSWDSAVAAATAGNPPCTSYVKSIRKLVELYSGGIGAPLIHEQDMFAKTMSENKRLGEEFMTAVVEAKLHEHEPRIHVRHALIACNLTASKVTDGIAKCIVKTDVMALGSKNKVDEVGEADKDLNAARSFVLEIIEKGGVSEQSGMDMIGLLRVRVGAHLCGKGKITFEATTYDSLSQIMALFLEAVTAKLKDNGANINVKLPGELSRHLPTAAANANEADSTADQDGDSTINVGPLSLDEASGKDFVAGQKGFKVGTVVFEKTVGHKVGVYVIISIGDEVNVVEHDNFNAAKLSVKIEFKKFMANWTVFKGELQIAIDGDWTSHYARREAVLLEMERCNLFLAMQSLDASIGIQPFGLVRLCVKPQALRAAVDCIKDAIQLVPTVRSLGYIAVQKCASVLEIKTQAKNDKGEGIVLYLLKHPQVTRHTSVAKWEKADCVVPYYWVGETSDKCAVNMKVHFVKHNGYNLPVLCNTKAVKKNDILSVYKEPKKAPVKLGTAASVELEPCKRQKR